MNFPRGMSFFKRPNQADSRTGVSFFQRPHHAAFGTAEVEARLLLLEALEHQLLLDLLLREHVQLAVPLERALPSLALVRLRKQIRWCQAKSSGARKVATSDNPIGAK